MAYRVRRLTNHASVLVEALDIQRSGNAEIRVFGAVVKPDRAGGPLRFWFQEARRAKGTRRWFVVENLVGLMLPTTGGRYKLAFADQGSVPAGDVVTRMQKAMRACEVKAPRQNPVKRARFESEADVKADPINQLSRAMERGDTFGWVVEHPTDADLARAWRASEDFASMISIYFELYPYDVHVHARLVAQISRAVIEHARSAEVRDVFGALRRIALRHSIERIEDSLGELEDFENRIYNLSPRGAPKSARDLFEAARYGRVLLSSWNRPPLAREAAILFVIDAIRTKFLTRQRAVDAVRRALPAPKLAEILGETRRNPARAGSRFAACVRGVSKRGGAYDPAAVCAAAGRRKYGAKKFAKLAAAGRKRAAKAKR